MRKLALWLAAIFLIGTITALLVRNDDIGMVTDNWTYLSDKSGLHYFFVVKISKKGHRTVEVTEKAYNSHSCGEYYNESWTKRE